MVLPVFVVDQSEPKHVVEQSHTTTTPHDKAHYTLTIVVYTLKNESSFTWHHGLEF